MKKFLFLTVTLILLLLSAFTASAERPEYSLEIPDGMISAAYGDDLTELAAVFDMNAESLQNYFDQNKVLFLAANPANTCQITLTCTENEFSKNAVSFSLLSEGEINTIANDLAGDSFDVKDVIQGEDGNPYIHLEKKLHDSGGDYSVTEYLTVCSSNLFTLSISVAELNKPDIKPDKVFAGLVINDTVRPAKDTDGLIYTALAVLGIAVFSALAVYLTYTVIRDMRKVRHSDE